MDFLLAILLAWFGMNLSPTQQQPFSVQTQESKKGSDRVVDERTFRPDPGKNHGPIIIVDDTHFKKDNQQ